jgi:peptidoglycan/xylan/chitin deacetylase (PgdA/CDA1 family)
VPAAMSTPQITRIERDLGFALSVDVEEWYHNCLVPAYVRPERRPLLPVELDRLLPRLLELLAAAGRQATFFVLGEVAERLPRRIRQLAEAGHEVASHGHLHLRACNRPLAEFRADIRRSKAFLEDILGDRVVGFRAPEWSLRSYRKPHLAEVVEAGFLYDSSLAPYSLSGTRKNPLYCSRIAGFAAGDILEFPPLTFGGVLRIPAGSWTGRLVEPERLLRAAARHHARGGLPVAVAHPWEISDADTPGPLSGLARFIHETGRRHYVPAFEKLLAGQPWSTISAACGLTASLRRPTVAAPRAAASRVSADRRRRRARGR